MNAKQVAAIVWLNQEILRHDGLQSVSDDYEYKMFEVHDTDPAYPCSKLVFLRTEVGRMNDENTAAWLVRTHRHIAIGPRGGVTLLNSRKGPQVKGRKVVYWITT